MKRSRTLTAVSAALAASLLAGCSSSNADEVRLEEPVLDFPQTSTTATPTPTTTKDADKDDEDEETTTSTTKTTTSKSSSSKSSSSKRTSTSSSKRSRSSSSDDSGNAAREPAPVRETIVDDRPGATCAWPTQGDASGSQEYSTFCDREWARTVTSDGQDYYWAAKGQGWVSVDPAGNDDNGVCWAPEDFETAPEAIRNAVSFCAPDAEEDGE